MKQGYQYRLCRHPKDNEIHKQHNKNKFCNLHETGQLLKNHKLVQLTQCETQFVYHVSIKEIEFVI